MLRPAPVRTPRPLWIVLAVLTALALVGCGESGESGESGGDFELTRATNAQVTTLVESELGDEVDGRPRVRDVECSARRFCIVRYLIDQPVLDAEREVLEAQRPIWRQLFADRQLKSAQLVGVGETTSPGGKVSTSPILELACNRRAHRQIDWGNVTAEGMRQLCDYLPLVNFD